MFLASLNVCKWRTRSARWSLHRMGQRSSGATAWFVNCRFRSSRPVGAAFVAINDLENMPVKTWLIWPEPLHQSAVSTTGRLLQVAFVAINDLENMPVKTWRIWPEPLHQSAVSTTGRQAGYRQAGAGFELFYRECFRRSATVPLPVMGRRTGRIIFLIADLLPRITRPPSVAPSRNDSREAGRPSRSQTA